MTSTFRITAALLSMAVLTATAQTVQQVSVGEATGFGIRYSLPQTAVRLQVTARCTTLKAGPYATYAEKLLGIADAPLEDQVQWEVTDLRLQAVGLPDTSRTYHIQFSGGIMPTFYLSEGLLCGINRAPEAVTPEAEAPARAEAAGAASVTPVAVMTEDLLRAGSKAKQAEVAARQVFRIRESRMDLLTGEADNAPADGAAYKLVMDNLDAQERASLSLFTGQREERFVTRTFTYIPAVASREEVLFRFSPLFGLLDADDLSGDPYTIRVTVAEDNREAPASADAKKKTIPSGIAYLLPGKLHVAVRKGAATVAETDVQAGQAGRVERLQPTYFTDKKHPASALFSPVSGAIQLFGQP